MSVSKRDYVADFIGLFNFEWHGENVVDKLPFLCCVEIVKNSIDDGNFHKHRTCMADLENPRSNNQ